MRENYVSVGTFQKPVGLEGELKADIREEFQEEFVQSDHVFILEHGNFVPWFIEDMRYSGFLIVKLEEIDTPEAASRFTLTDIYIKSSTIASPELKSRIGKQNWVGYRVYDDKTILGVIEEVVLYPGQEVASITYNDKKILIPLADALITSVDKEKKNLYMSLPEGLYN